MEELKKKEQRELSVRLQYPHKHGRFLKKIGSRMLIFKKRNTCVTQNAYPYETKTNNNYNILPLSTAAVSRDENSGTCGPLKTTISEEDKCYIEGVPTKCKDSTIALSEVMKKCRFPYTNHGQENATYNCGQLSIWEPPYDLCQADCGIATPSNKFPWVAGIYDSKQELLCDGVIISPYHVVTAADCFRSVGFTSVGYGVQLRRDVDLTIIAGKHYINLNRKTYSQQNRKVKESYIHDDYNFWSGLHNKGNIILLEVDKEFAFFDDVRPVCIDWESFYEEWEFKQDNDGIVTGLEYDGNEVVPCGASSIRYWQRNICWENLSNHFGKEYFSTDKSCAQYIDDNSVNSKCRGIALYFKPNQQRYFLRGLLSKTNSTQKGYVLYTKIATYIEWLKLVMKKNKRINTNFETFAKDVYDGAGSCILPEHIRYGKFSLVVGQTYPGGTKVSPFTVILLSCNDNKTTKYFRCLKDEWYPSIDEAVCTKPESCPSLLTTEYEKVFCKLNDSQISCEEPPANTIAVIVCQPFYTFMGQKPVYNCQNGKWNPPFTSCTLECGLKRVEVSTLAIGGSEAYENEYPWVTAIYYKDTQICGGTLISRYYVISAAHCFTNSKGIHKPIDEYTIIAGKYFRDIGIEEFGSQKRKIKHLHVPEDYKGSLLKYRDDVALVELDQKLTVSLEVQPVCVDWDSSFEDIDFTVGKMGVVAGWGFTQEAGSPSDVLKKIVVPFQPKDVCLKYLPVDFGTQYVATDKFCAGYKDNNTNVCKGDSGGGLYFKSDGMHYFLRGIVSLTVLSDTGCDANLFALYTRVSKYLPWVANITRKIL